MFNGVGLKGPIALFLLLRHEQGQSMVYALLGSQELLRGL